MNKLTGNPFLRRPDHPNYHRRARHHNYRRPAKYLVTTLKNPSIPPFARVEGNPYMTDGEYGPHIVLTPTGKFIIEAMKLWLIKYPQLEISEFIIMPDHIHLCIEVKKYLPNGLSIAISGLKGKVSSLRHNALPEQLRPEKLASVFEKGFNDRIAYNDEQWGRQKNYVLDNPRRFLIKKIIS